MIGWIKATATRWVIITGTGMFDGEQTLIAQRGNTSVILDVDGDRIGSVEWETEELALNAFHGAIAHMSDAHGSVITESWTDAEVAAL